MSHGSTQDGKVEQQNYCGFDEVQLYKDLKAPTKEGKSLGDGMVNIYSGRPKWGPRFEAVHTNHPDKNIGVTFCGHPMIANQLKLFSYEFNRKRPVKKFKFYKENF
jgi:hypothetical protein